MKPFAFPDDNCLDDPSDKEYFERLERICVDVVADGGKSWIKVVARKPEALLASIKGELIEWTNKICCSFQTQLLVIVNVPDFH